MPKNELEQLVAAILEDRDARTAAKENDLRRRIAAAFDAARNKKGLSIRGLAREMGTSISQVQRLLHNEVGGSLTTRSICRAADVLGLDVTMDAHAPREETTEVREVTRNDALWRSLVSLMFTTECIVSSVQALEASLQSRHRAVQPWEETPQLSVVESDEVRVS